SPLLGAPVVKLRRHHGVYVRAELRVAQHVHGIARGAEDFFQVTRGHQSVPLGLSELRMIAYFVCNTNDLRAAGGRLCRNGLAGVPRGQAGFETTTFPNSAAEAW